MAFLDALKGFAGSLQPFAQNQQNNQNTTNAYALARNPQFAQALMGVQQGQMLQDEYQRKLRQQEALKQLAGQLQGSEINGIAGPLQTGGMDRQSALAKYAQITGDLNPLFGVGTDSPSAVREYQFFNGLDPQSQQKYLAVKRAQQIVNTGDAQTVVNPLGGVKEEFAIDVSPDARPETRADQAAAVKAAETNIQKQIDYPRVEAQVKNNIKVIDDALNHPGFDANFGKRGVIPNFPGSEASDAATYLDQIKGTAFLTAIGEMKGSGAISEKEGDAATAAVARLGKAQSPESARKALEDLKTALGGSLQRASTGVIPPVTASQLNGFPQGQALPPQLPVSGLNGWSVEVVE